MPNVPTVVELGYPEAATLPTYVGLYAHKDTPEAIRNALTDAIERPTRILNFKRALTPSASSHDSESRTF